MSHPERGGDATKPVFVDNRDGNTLARAITTHLAAPRQEGRTPAELCVASCYFNPQGLELIAGEARHVPRIRLLLGADPTPEALRPRRREQVLKAARFEDSDQRRAAAIKAAAPTMTARLNAQGLGGFASFLASANGLPTRPPVGRTPA